MSRRLALAILPALAMTMTVAGAQTRMPVIAGAEGVPTFEASLSSAHGTAASSELSLDGRAFAARDGGQASLSKQFAIVGDGLPTLPGNAAQAQEGAHRAPARAVVVNASRIARLPEPATWAMMIIGFGLIGGAVRRGLRKSDERFNTYIRSITEDADA